MTLSAVQWDFANQEAEDNYQRALRRYPAQVVVDLATLRDNMKAMVDRVHAVNPSTAVLGVVKADAYGHGLLPTALAALAGGATWLGTAQSREALLLRQKGVGPDRARIITWLYNGRQDPFDRLISQDIDLAVGSLAGIDAIVRGAQKIGRPARVHVKVDTGFGRNGFTPEEFDQALTRLRQGVDAGQLEVVGQWSHLSVADAPEDPASRRATDDQIALFNEFTDRMKAAGLPPSIRHLANTAATFTRPEIYFELVRPGVGLYGYEPDPVMGTGEDYGLKPAMTLQAQLGTVKNLPAGHSISYGRTYLTEEETSTADLPLGYADGIPRSASGFNRAGALGVDHPGGPVRIMTNQGPRLVRVSGRVCMDQCILDLHGSAEDWGVSEGDTVELFGPGRGEAYAEPTADDWARAAGTISYEIFTCLRNRIPRLYLHAQNVLSAEDVGLLDPTTVI
ncbi:alanine racemase [Parascardovia denticolens IPLA 20019]|uniref:alanine racemase n=1 Tax=Parascardovia denticolens TaxID=78258 RepID=UPI000266CD12|nr:alanine racemase [Parascardovia denticolens]EIT88383.1 alanine racemase [Parascardovia denticolens IPLA 20019]